MEFFANLVAALHIGYFLFVVGGFVGILVGARLGWPWIRNPWFRITHLLAVLTIVAEDVFHFPCFLNVVETNLRAPPQIQAPSGASGVLDLLLRHTIPGWFLDGMYWILSAVLVLLLFVVPPRFRGSRWA